MHEFCEFHEYSTLNYSTTMDAITVALKDIDLQDTVNYSAVAKAHGVDRSTLSRRHRGVTQSAKVKHQKQQLLSPEQERTLVDYINKLTENGLCPTPSMLRQFAFDIAKKLPKKDWSHEFCKRWSSRLSSRYMTAIDAARSKADSEQSYRLYFDLIKEKMEQYEVQGHNIYNMDEKGFLIGYLTKARRIFSKEAFQKGRVLGNNQDGNREWITVIASVCADGSSLPPALIYQASSGNLQDSWLQDFDSDNDVVHFASSEKGWTNDELGFRWLEDIFDRYTKPKARLKWRLLIIDGHGSHVNMRFLEWASSHKICVLVILSHATYRLRPLNVSLSNALAVAYGQKLDRFFTDC